MVITEQLLSRISYTTDGTTTSWPFSFSGGYLLSSHVKAYTTDSSNVVTPVTGTLTGPFTLSITPAIPAGKTLTIYRDTPKAAPMVDFANETGFSEIALDTNAKQAVFAAAEAADASVYGKAYAKAQAELAASYAAAAGSSADIAASYANGASNALSSASAAATAAAASYDAFDDRYLGSKATAPSLDNDGNALIVGALYWNSSVSKQYVWTGTSWVTSDILGATVAGNLSFTSTGSRITGDFSNATASSRVAIQTSVANGNTIVPLYPNGTGTVVGFSAPSTPMSFYTGGSEMMRIDTSGVVQVAASGAAPYGDGAYGTPRMQWNAKTGTHSGAVSIADATTLLSHLLLKNPNGVIASFATSGNDTVIANAGNFVVSGAAGGLGYGAGAGGAVMQATSRTTAVTINKPTGQIAMFGASGSPVPALFAVNNSRVSANDTVIVSLKTGASNFYVFQILGVSNGQFVIQFYAQSGVAVDAPVINFAIIKGSAA